MQLCPCSHSWINQSRKSQLWWCETFKQFVERPIDDELKPPANSHTSTLSWKWIPPRSSFQMIAAPADILTTVSTEISWAKTIQYTVPEFLYVKLRFCCFKSLNLGMDCYVPMIINNYAWIPGINSNLSLLNNNNLSGLCPWFLGGNL